VLTKVLRDERFLSRGFTAGRRKQQEEAKDMNPLPCACGNRARQITLHMSGDLHVPHRIADAPRLKWFNFIFPVCYLLIPTPRKRSPYFVECWANCHRYLKLNSNTSAPSGRDIPLLTALAVARHSYRSRSGRRAELIQDY
jgi:hypothetical protein